MAEIMENTITTINEYVSYIEDLPSEFSLSRGQSKDYQLYPGAFRRDQEGKALYSDTDRKRFIDSFKIYAAQYLHDIDIKSDAEWLVLAQHFGVNTCLLDFTYSPLLALLFAIEDAFEFNTEAEEENQNYAVVWFLNPYELNDEALNDRTIINLSNCNFETYQKVKMPFVCTANRNNRRIAAQNGLFVYFNDKRHPLESLDISSKVLKKVIVPYEYTKGLLCSLYRLGLRFNSVYPELTSISKDIKLEYDIKEYINNMKE